jgi:hypothetical protein
MTRTRHGEVELEAIGSNEEGLSMSLAPWRVLEGELLMVDVGESVAVASLRVLSQSSWRWTRAKQRKGKHRNFFKWAVWYAGRDKT